METQIAKLRLAYFHDSTPPKMDAYYRVEATAIEKEAIRDVAGVVVVSGFADGVSYRRLEEDYDPADFGADFFEVETIAHGWGGSNWGDCAVWIDDYPKFCELFG